ncbi:hypothetical protein HELRODRAFT_164022 [Helobdella robusta]|uniref:Uncharacterized protein n=1 Tax=Helobdella robusta TaxID=6412 RepID=T1EUS4_HELRO|nr:hypothetical protein HELRODRAFT_164022 [Helobdella robusta]ESN94223.1 hypothetical protein HELRODRAFT_164022 [Helobdella robusta]
MTKEINKPRHIGNLTRTFVIDKFSRKTSNVSQWMNIFETECARLGIDEDTKKIEALRRNMTQTGGHAEFVKKKKKELAIIQNLGVGSKTKTVIDHEETTLKALTILN